MRRYVLLVPVIYVFIYVRVGDFDEVVKSNQTNQ